MTRIIWVAIVPLALLSCQRKGGNAGVELKNADDSAGYALGVDLASRLTEQKMGSLNFGMISYAMGQVLTGKPTQIELPACGMVLQQFGMQISFDSTAAAYRGKNEVKTKDDKAVLTNIYDSAGYALGVDLGNRLKSQGMGGLNRDLMDRAINVVLAGDSTLIKPMDCINVLNQYMMTKSKGQTDANIKEGEEFLAKNGKRAEVKTTASGLQYEVIREGTGAKPTANDIFVAHYRGTLLDGTVVDESYKRNEPLEMPVGQVISGWIEGLQLMSVGSHYKFYIPYEMAYGLQGNPPVVPGGSTLIFDLELLDVKKGPAK